MDTTLIVRQLLRQSTEADDLSEAGTKLVGHIPRVAPRAFCHVLYAPLESAAILDLQSKLGRTLPPAYEKFLMVANGMIIFLGAMRVFGFVPKQRRFDLHIHNYPPDVVAANLREIDDVLPRGSLIVGFYQVDGSFTYLDVNGRAFRIDLAHQFDPIDQWIGFDDWLTSEIRRLAREYDDDLSQKRFQH